MRRLHAVAIGFVLALSVLAAPAAADETVTVAHVRVGADGWSYELVIGTDSGNRTVPLNRPALSRPALSPDGTRVAFVSPLTDGTDGRFGVFTSNLDGTDIRRITTSSGADSDPAWSPDGRYIAFSRDTAGSLDPDICCVIRVVEADGTESFTIPGTIGGINPAWSPDGTEIVYEHPDGLFVTSLDGTSSRRIAPAGSGQPAWAPDGSAVAYIARTATGWQLATRAPYGGNRVVRVSATSGLEAPAFGPDSEAIYYVRFAGAGYDGRTDGRLWVHRPGAGSVSVYSDPTSPMIHASLFVRMSDLPHCDVDGNGIGDLLVGAPGDDDAVNDAGVITLIPGSLTQIGSATQWHQNSPGVLGIANAGDEFGASLACGDFNGDGRSDAAIGAPGNGSGAVNVLRGSAAGLTASNDQIWKQDTPGVPGTGQAGDRFGAALAAGDFNGDGRSDLAVGAPTGSGAVNVLYGSAGGLTASGGELWKPEDVGLGNSTGAAMGHSLAAGDVNGDGYDDLVVGIPGADVGGLTDTGGFAVLVGSDSGLGFRGFWGQDTPGVAGIAHSGDLLGWAVVVGDLDGDGYGDVAAGAPGAGHGSINVLYGSPTGPSTRGDQVWKQNSPQVLGVGRGTDRFGTSVASGDLNGDGFADLAVGVPGSGPGAVNVLYGSGDGLTAAGNQLWKQNTPGVRGVAHVGDAFGTAVAIDDFDGDGIGDLAVGAPGNGPGAVNVLFGSGSRGVSASGDLLFKQGYEGLPGTPSGGDAHGSSLR